MSTLALQKAIQIAGTQTELARRIGKTQAHVWNWLHRDHRVPADVAARIEAATDGQVKKEELRPDVFLLAVPLNK